MVVSLVRPPLLGRAMCSVVAVPTLFVHEHRRVVVRFSPGGVGSTPHALFLLSSPSFFAASSVALSARVVRIFLGRCLPRASAVAERFAHTPPPPPLRPLPTARFENNPKHTHAHNAAILSLRTRSIRRFYAVVSQMLPGFLRVCLPVVFFLLLSASYAALSFGRAKSDFEDPGASGYAIW